MTKVEERREKARLRSEGWRRAHGIMLRRPAQRPWLAEGISRSTWYRRRKQAREREALAAKRSEFSRNLPRAEAFVAALQAALAEAARCQAAMGALLSELAAFIYVSVERAVQR
ncbi:MAG: hypothetical protein ACLP4V_00700 [Methylocella sp.]